jgi:hypothetical protein
MNLLQKNGQTITDKKSIKALSTMTGAQAKMADNLSSFQGCVLPSETMKTLNISVTNNNCTLPNIQNNYNLVYTSDGILSMNPQVQTQQIKKGQGIYPSKGCLYNFENGNTNEMIENVSSVIDSSNKQELARLNQLIVDLKNDCNEIDRLIGNENKNLTEAINKLNIQINVCKKYKIDISYYNSLTTDIKNKINIETNNLSVANSQYQESIRSGQFMVKKCNMDIKHCFAYQDCNYSGTKKKIFGYIGNLQKYGFNSISSFQIPPGIEVRVFDDLEYIGGNSMFVAPLNSRGLDKACLVDDEYTQQIMNKDNTLGGLSIVTAKRNWNDNIRSIRIRRAEDYSFTPAAVIETFQNYNDTVKTPLTHLETPGNIDNYFYAPANLTVKNTGKDHVADYMLYDNKDVLGGSLTNYVKVAKNDEFLNNEQVKKLYNEAELSGIPVQQCAKWCTDNRSKCDAFIYKAVDMTCDIYKKDASRPFVVASTNKCGNGSGTCKSYILNTFIKGKDIIDPPQLPEGPYKKTCDINLGTYQNGILTTTCPKPKETFVNSSIKYDDCISNTIRADGNNKLTCDKKPLPACPRPNGWCTSEGAAYVNIDCLGDGIVGDHLCKDGERQTGSILRIDGCKSTWPKDPETKCKAEWDKLKPQSCVKPKDWCSGDGKIYANVDCMGNGIKGDHLCVDYKSKDKKNGSLLRSSDCINTLAIGMEKEETCKNEWAALKDKIPKRVSFEMKIKNNIVFSQGKIPYDDIVFEEGVKMTKGDGKFIVPTDGDYKFVVNFEFGWQTVDRAWSPLLTYGLLKIKSESINPSKIDVHSNEFKTNSIKDIDILFKKSIILYHGNGWGFKDKYNDTNDDNKVIINCVKGEIIMPFVSFDLGLGATFKLINGGSNLFSGKLVL